MIHHSVLVDVSSEILNGKDRIMSKRITVASINPYSLNLLINQIIFRITNGQHRHAWGSDKINYSFKEFSLKYAI